MSRLTDLLEQARKLSPQLASDIESEVRTLSQQRTFGLVFEPHQPEAVQLPKHPVRKGNKVRMLSPRGDLAKGDDRLWRVQSINRDDKVANLIELEADEPQTRQVSTDDLVVVAEFHDTIYPGLVETDRIEQGGDKPFHTVINAENYHALELLTYTHRHRIDAIYIDPPYNTGAKDWKYNNDYVASEDDYRHSKWLAFMERRLTIARGLLNPENSVLIVTIDEKEYLRLGLLLEQTFPEARIQMVSSIINRKGVVRFNELSRTNEFIYILKFGSVELCAERQASEDKVRWASLRRFEESSKRHGSTPRLQQFYPIYVGMKSGKIESVGEPIGLEIDRNSVTDVENCYTLWPIKPDGTEMTWGLTPPSLLQRMENGYVKVSMGKRGKPPTIYYLTSGQIDDIKNGELVTAGRDSDGSLIVEYATGKASLPSTQWDKESHNAQSNGTGMLSSLLPKRKFPFAKSLYAVEDSLRLAVGNKSDAIILDFFSGSGTTAHAVMRLNRQDGGRRQCISVTNNEVGADEQVYLRKKGLRPGDREWEQWGICEYITKPRIKAAITGRTPEDKPIQGDYKFTDESPMAEGFKENAAFFTLTYEAPFSISHHRAFKQIAPLLWLRAGSEGRIITDLGERGWDVSERYGVLHNLDDSKAFLAELEKAEDVRLAYIVTNDDAAFQMIHHDLPDGVTSVRLYESYLQNFHINSGRMD